jgi:hypothetical protein
MEHRPGPHTEEYNNAVVFLSTPVSFTRTRPSNSFHFARLSARTLSNAKSGISSSALAQAWSADINDTPARTSKVVFEPPCEGLYDTSDPASLTAPAIQCGPRFSHLDTWPARTHLDKAATASHSLLRQSCPARHHTR